MDQESASKKTPKDVFHIQEGKDGKSHWLRIGAAYVNRDGSLNAFLDLLPRDGKIHIRESKFAKTKQEE